MMIAKRILLILSIIVAALSFQGCEYVKAYRLASGFLDCELDLSSKMIRVENGEAHECEYLQKSPVYVIYYSPDECSKCAINHMLANKPYFDFSKRQGGFETIIVVAPKEDSFSEILALAEQQELAFPIYIDKDHHLEAQGVIPNDERVHNFLLDKEGTVSYIGRPLTSEKTQKRFIQCLTKLNDK
jgi:peroxiredoxin